MAKVLVSACLGGRACRYDARSCPSAGLDQGDDEWVLFCPEEAGGLPTPRTPAEIVGGDGADVLAGRARVLTACGEDVTEAFVAGAEAALHLCQQQGIGRAVLKSRSPSCGASHIHDGSFLGGLRKGQGVTAALLRQHGIAVDEMST